jgi:glycosyltransferase involved in cell wall biosynthesis
MRILIATDAWTPQVNGVVRTLQATITLLRRWGNEVHVVSPQGQRSLPMPGYPEIRMAMFPARAVRKACETFEPEAVHIATEGPIGWATRRWCLHHDVPFTTSYHTRFPEYLRSRLPIPLALSYAVLRHFHAPAATVLAPTPTQRFRLLQNGFDNVRIWSRGVDVATFQPWGKAALDHLPRPVHLYMGRVSVEKNLDDFLSLALPGSKVVIGDGPQRKQLEARYADVHFLGYQHGETLARHLAAADVFVFPSRTDTFGLVLLEAMACGVPVAAYPVTGPVDVVKEGVSGSLNDDLRDAIAAALNCRPDDCRNHALQYSWDRATRQFLDALQSRNTSGLLSLSVGN